MTSESMSSDLVPARPPDPDSSPPVNPPTDAAFMPLVDHLAELRTRILWTVVAIGIGAIIGFFASETLIRLLTEALPTQQKLVVLQIGDAFAIRLRLSIVIGIILAMPVILWNVWRF